MFYMLRYLGIKKSISSRNQFTKVYALNIDSQDFEKHFSMVGLSAYMLNFFRAPL